jgi:hypothetical protein
VQSPIVFNNNANATNTSEHSNVLFVNEYAHMHYDFVSRPDNEPWTQSLSLSKFISRQ